MSFKPERGDIILAGTHEVEREFVAMDGDFYICRGIVGVDQNPTYNRWHSAKPLPTKPEPVHFTYETWPKQPVWLRQANSECGACFMVVARYNLGVIHKASYYSN